MIEIDDDFKKEVDMLIKGVTSRGSHWTDEAVKYLMYCMEKGIGKNIASRLLRKRFNCDRFTPGSVGYKMMAIKDQSNQ